MTMLDKPERLGFAVLMKGFLGTDPYQFILCGDRLRFASGWRKNDGFRHWLWISALEKQVGD
ncbi:hypothetical protein [Serratia sp. N21D137]|uniref:hypothetical protein n=1 Tax=Serratia sp. N21D137 TaxID=3397495 RepID=UPI0039E07F79